MPNPVSGLRALKEALRASPLAKSLPEVKEFYTWHGSPYTFMPEDTAPLGRFLNEKLGTGEGAQAFTYGHYTTGSKGLAKEYRDALARRHGTDGKGRERLTKGEIAEIAPDAAFIPSMRFNTHASGNPALWLGSDKASQMADRMMANPTWVQKYAPPPVVVPYDPAMAEALQDVASRYDPRAWVAPALLNAPRARVGALRQLQSAESTRRNLANLPPEVYAALAQDLQLSADPNEVTKAMWLNALTKGDPRRHLGSWEVSDALNRNWDMMLRGKPKIEGSYYTREAPLPQLKSATRSALEAAHQLPEGYATTTGEYGAADRSAYNRDMRVLGRSGLLDFAQQLKDPARLAELRAHFSLGEPGKSVKSLYRARQDVSPADLWFLGMPLIGQTDPFIRRFQGAGQAMTPDFGLRQSLSQPGMNTYRWLQGVPKAPSGLSSVPHSGKRNAEITDYLLRAGIPGAMFLRGGRRGSLDKVLEQPFDPYDFNFVTFDPSTAHIVERHKQGGPV